MEHAWFSLSNLSKIANILNVFTTELYRYFDSQLQMKICYVSEQWMSEMYKKTDETKVAILIHVIWESQNKTSSLHKLIKMALAMVWNFSQQDNSVTTSMHT